MEKEDHMEIVSDPTFWADTGLVAASRLAVLAAALWVARLAVRGWMPRPAVAREAPRAPELQPRTVPAPMTRAPERSAPAPRYVDLRSSKPGQPAPVATRAEDAARREHLQNRLMEYLDQRVTERTHS